MTGPEVMAYLRRLCRELDLWRSPGARKAAAAVSIPAALFAQGCRGFEPEPSVALYGVPEYGAVFEEVCDDGWDNDGDGQTDCQDAVCEALELCLGCLDGLDNDGNGLSDCADTASCSAAEACVGDCNDGTDEDGDGLSDCDDPDCAGSPGCP